MSMEGVMRTSWLSLILVAAILPAHAGAIYRCKDDSGKTTFQGHPCGIEKPEPKLKSGIDPATDPAAHDRVQGGFSVVGKGPARGATPSAGRGTAGAAPGTRSLGYVVPSAVSNQVNGK
jgi:hypothetical protein